MRTASLSDVEQLSRLETILFSNSMGERMLRQELRLGKGWIEERPSMDGDDIVGYALIRPDGDIIDLTRLGVHPEVQQQGIGTRLLKQVLEEGRDVILTVAKDNLAALKLYRKHGFTIVGHLQQAGAWVMRANFAEEGG